MKNYILFKLITFSCRLLDFLIDLIVKIIMKSQKYYSTTLIFKITVVNIKFEDKIH